MLRAEGVSFRYPQEDRGLPPTSLTVDPGALTLVTGPSGCGKSTLARCLVGLIPHLYHGELTGEVWLNGYRASATPMWQLAEHAGMLFQNPAAQMLAASVEDEIIFGLENLGLPRAEIEARLESALDQFGLTPLRERNPQSLSGGEQQKLAVAAVMARRPEALILDEPLSMLDTTAAGELITYLEGFTAAGKTVAIFEHREAYLEGVAGLRHVRLPGKSAASLPEAKGTVPRDRQAFRLEIENLRVQLGTRTVIRDLGLSLHSGQVVAVVGCNGAGKTTLLRTLCGLQKHTGSLQVTSPVGDSRPDFGMVFQNPDLQLFNASVRDEILYRLPHPDMAQYRWLLSALGLEAYEHTPPLLLSEGEKKRLSLALVLMHRPVHGLLLDEPSLGQDSLHKDILMRLLRSLAEAGQLVVMTTHDLTLASQADYLVLLEPEGVCAEGAPELVFQDRAAWERAGIVLPAWFLRERGEPAI